MDTSWSKTTRILVVLLSLAAAVWLAFIATPLLEAILIAGLLAYLLNPAVCWLVRRSPLRRAQAAGVVFLLTMLVVVSIPAALGTVAVNYMDRIGADFLTAADELEQWLARPIEVLGFHLQPRQMIDSLQGVGAGVLASLPGGSLGILSSVTTNLLWAATVLIMYYYLLKDGQKIRPWLVTMAPDPHRPELDRLLGEVDHVWGKFLRIQLLMFFVIFMLMLIGTLLIVGLFRSGYLRWSPLGFIALLLLLYTAIQQLDNLWIRPHILGKQLRLHPGVVFAGLFGALMLSGLLGALLVVPLLATVKVVGSYVHRKLFGQSPWPEERAEAVSEEDQAGVESFADQEKERAYQA